MKLLLLKKDQLFVFTIFFLSIISVISRDIQAQGTSSVYVRRNIATLSSTEIDSLRRGIQAMQAKAATDPTSWIFQANIHGTVDTPADTMWNQCQHGTFFFLSWHRMYLYYFERILRAAAEDPNLTIPYWNYSDDPQQRVLPVAFREPADASNPFYVSERSQDINNGTPLPDSAIDYSQAFSYINFISRSRRRLGFGGQRTRRPSHSGSGFGALEMTPHNAVHAVIGGNGGWMNDPNWAARDPIFWVHHANIDRLWNRWLEQGGGRQNPTDDSIWMDTLFQFYDENGTVVEMSGRDVVNVVQQLNYQYDDAPAESINTAAVPSTTATVDSALTTATASTPSMTKEKKEKLSTLIGKSSKEEFDLSTPWLTVSIEVEDTSVEPSHAGPPDDMPNSLFLNIKGVKFTEYPGAYYEVYLNIPKDVTSISYNSHRDHYIGNLTFFGMHKNKENEYHFDITKAIQKLKEHNRWNDKNVSVTFVEQGGVSTSSAAKTVKPSKPNIKFSQIEIIKP